MNAGEVEAQNYLLKNGWKVKNLTACKDFFSKDIDFLIERDQERFYIEIKWDTRIKHTGNMFIEVSTDIENNKDGWYNYCEADFIFYGDALNKLFYVFRLQDLKEFIKGDYKRLQQRKAADYTIYGRVKKVSQGLLVPIEELRKSYPVQVIKL